MSRVDTLLAHVAPGARAELALVADLERVLDELVASARRAWPGIDVADEVFLRHVASHLPNEEAARALLALHAEDLYLACACAAGDERAGPALEGRLAEVAPAVARQAGAELVDEVLQHLRQRLLVPEPGERRRIGDYSGRGPLSAWLRVAAVRIALDHHRRTHRESPADVRDLADLQAASDPELAAIKGRALEEFKTAFHAALALLTTQERNILRLHFLDGLSIDEIGTIYRVHRSTVARWLARSRESLLRETRKRMREKLRLATGEFESLMGVVQSQLDVSIHRFLSQSDG